MTLQQFFLMLRARWRIATFTFMVLVMLALVISLILPSKYTATATVVIDSKATDPISGTLYPISSSYMATQIDIINSDRVATRVVKLLKLDQNPATVEQWKESTEGRGSMERWIGDYMKRNLEAKPSRESNVINIEYVSPEPKAAAVLANAFAQAYIDTTLELRVEPARQSAAWFDERSKALREALEKAQRALSTYQQEHGIVATDERLDVENARLNELSSQYTAVQAQKVDAQTRHTQSKKEQLETMPEVLQNSLIQGLKSDVARLESKLTELGGQLGTKHPQYQRLQDEKNAMQQKLDAEIQRVISGLATSGRVNEKREGEIKAAIDLQKEKILKLKQERDQITVLVRDVETAQRAYDAVNQRLNQTSLESQVNLTNIALLNPATEPLVASSPKTRKNLLIAVFLGTLLGVGMAFLAEFIDRRVRSEDDLIEIIDATFLGPLHGLEKKESRLMLWFNRQLARFSPKLA